MANQTGISRVVLYPELRKLDPNPEAAISELYAYLVQFESALVDSYDKITKRLNELDEMVVLPFFQDNVAAAQTDVALGGPSSTRGYVAPEDGSIVSIAVRSNAARSAGSFTVTPRVNGTKATFSVTIDATNTTTHYDRQDQGIDVFAATDLLDCVLSSTAGWLPVTADIDVSIGVVLFKGTE